MTSVKRLGILVPSRGRPGPMLRLADAVEALSTSGSTELLVGVDHDDGSLSGYKASLSGRPGVHLLVGQRESMVARTNTMWRDYSDVYEFWCSLGDDHVPRTPGWDTSLIEAIEAMGGTGIAYPNDTVMGPDLPTAVVMSADIAAVLGWMAYPGVRHYCCDNVWKVLGEGAGCLAYLPGTIVEHLHHTTGRSSFDATYAEAGGFTPGGDDYRDYQHWLHNEAEADVGRVFSLRK